MNALARQLQDLYYLKFSAMVKLLGGLKTPQRSYAVARLLGSLRMTFGVFGPNWSKEKYFSTMKAILPDSSDQELADILRAYWVNHQKRFIELFLARELTPGNIDRMVEFEGLEYLDQALEKGRGILLPVPHIGNERLHHILLALKGYPVAVVSSNYDDHGPIARRVKLDASRRFHEVGHPGDVRWLLRMLKDNRVLQVACDAEAGETGIVAEFLGQKILLPTGWVRLALKTGAAVFPSTLLRQEDNRHKLVIRPAHEVRQGTDKRATLRDNVQRYMDTVAEIFRERPDLIDWMSLTVRLDETSVARS
jgi:KDO2-lipid IV(A) lauroyltransferase